MLIDSFIILKSRRESMKILITGFEPFGGEKVNPSMEIVKRVSKKTFSDILVNHLILPVSYEKSIIKLGEYYDNHEVDVAIHIGQAGGSATIRVERVAVNLMDSKHPDNDNQLRNDIPIIESGADAYMTKMKVKAIVDFLNNKKIPTTVSYTAGQYICNEVFYYSLYCSHKNNNPRHALFIHVPFLPKQVAESNLKKDSLPSMSLELQTRAINLIIENLKEFI